MKTVEPRFFVYLKKTLTFSDAKNRIFPMTILNEFRRQLKAYLRTHQMKPYKLARKAHVPQACIYEFLRERQGLHPKTIDKLRKAMK
jgi:hypothetical protein